jgi:hypothetical protein
MFGLAGRDELLESKRVASSSGPLWEERPFLEGYSVENDVVHVWAHEKVDSLHDGIICYFGSGH